jgi:hypothetical protein
VEQTPGPITGDGQDELVVRAESDACHGEGVALERLSERPEVLRIVDSNRGMLRTCGFACGRDQPARRRDLDSDRLLRAINVKNVRVASRSDLIAMTEDLLYLGPKRHGSEL